VTPDELAAAMRRLDETVELFRRAAAKAVATAATPTSYPMVVTETRHQATFALAAVGAAFKAALKAARPDDPAV
jgi:hypothetical protein